MKDLEQSKILCGKCNIPLESRKTDLKYQNQTLSASLLKCPQCEQVYIPEELAKGKMLEIEKSLEDK